MNRVIIMWLVNIAVLSIIGCAHSGIMKSAGDHVSYAVWNHRTDITVDEPKLVDANGKTLASGLSDYPRPIDSIGWQGRGATLTGDNLQSGVPEQVVVSWRMPPKSGQLLYEGDLVGPFTIPLRSRIPQDVLNKVKGSKIYKLEIGVSVGVEPILVRWQLVEYLSTGLHEIRRGGNW
jgi:hypothetical protein